MFDDWWYLYLFWKEELTYYLYFHSSLMSYDIVQGDFLEPDCITWCYSLSGGSGSPAISLMPSWLGVSWCFCLGVAQWCSALLSVAQHCSMLLSIAQCCSAMLGITQCCSLLCAVALHCTLLHAVAFHCTLPFLGIDWHCSAWKKCSNSQISLLQYDTPCIELFPKCLPQQKNETF